MKLKTLVAVLLSVIMIQPVAETSLYACRKKKKKAKTEVKAPVKKKSEYQKLMKEVADSAKSDFLSIYKTKKGKIYIEYPANMLGRRLLVGATMSTVSNARYINIGYKYEDPIYIKIEKKDSSMVISNIAPYITTSDEKAFKKALANNYAESVEAILPIKAYSKDSSSFIFDATKFVEKRFPKISTIKVETSKDLGELNYFGKVKAFKDNASIELHKKVTFQQRFLGISFDVGSGSLSANVSFLLLPEKKMLPRIQDSRIGVFSSGGATGTLYDLEVKQDGMRRYMFANRWNLEPVDIDAWRSGKLTEVKKPIVWYVDDAFPEVWRKPIFDGILAWNQAFEKIGFKNAIQAKMFPTKEEDPDFDPDNLKYSCVRYLAKPVMNAMGPSWADPATGEILNASVLVYNDVLKLINNWRFIQTAQIDPRVRTKKMPQDVVDQAMVYVISHEIGHTLGLMHNMAGSSAFPVDSLRSATFTNKYGTATSIMDYARFNYIAQPQDKNKGLRLVPAKLGVYDEYAIKWLYTPVLGTDDMWEASKRAAKLIDEKAGDPMYRYGAQQIKFMLFGHYDPSSLSEDLGDDPIKASNYGIKNLKYILPNLNKWIKNDEDYYHRRNLYKGIAGQLYGYIDNVLQQVGGIYLYQVQQGTPGKPCVSVPKAKQRASLKWVIDNLSNSSWLANKEISSNFPLHVTPAGKISLYLAMDIAIIRPQYVTLSSSYAKKGDAYTIDEFYSDLYKYLFKNSISGRKLSIEEKTLQKTILKFSLLPLMSLSKNGKVSLTLKDELEAVLKEVGVEDVKEDMSLLSKKDLCSTTSFGEADFPFQYAVSIYTISEINGNRQIFVEKVKALTSRLKKTAPLADRAHYTELNKMATVALGD